MKIEGLFFVECIVVMLITILTLKFLIPILASKKMGQKILEIGPRWHKNKEGTPTMGGISFIFAFLIAFAVFLFIYGTKVEAKQLVCALNIIIYALLNAMIGIIDDFAKLRKAKNEGLTPLAKFSFQAVVAVLFLISLHFSIGINTNLYIPFFDVSIQLGFFYYVLAFFILCGVVNSVNLTDGIDGLASSVTFVVGLFFAVLNFIELKDPTIAFFSAALIGGTLGFLAYNFYPAKVFMGDTGSLFLGAIIVSISFLIDNILLVFVYGIVFICEAISVILQVLYYKATKGKRLFKMAPLHHHFEKIGFGEVKIVLIFSLVNAIFCVLAFFGVGNL